MSGLIPSVISHGRLSGAVILFVALMLPMSASGIDADTLGLVPRTKVQVGQKLGLQLNPQVPLKKVTVVLTPDKGRPIRLKSGKIGFGGKKTLTFSHPVGTRKWRAEFAIVTAGGDKGKVELTFETTVFPAIAMRIAKKDVNLEEHFLELTLNQPAAKVDIQVIGDDGKPIHKDTTEFESEAAGTPLRVEWEQPAGVAVLKINIRAWSAFGFWTGIEITPFEIEIPHEDVVFDTGKSAIKPSEAPKIDRTLALLSEKIKRYGGLVKLQLYIAGYTDTVGGRPSNQQLSEKRARSIGTYFRRKGVPIPIYYQGFGESVLAVKTPDETDEAKNRRAVYVLSASAPAIQAQLPRAAWKRL